MTKICNISSYAKSYNIPLSISRLEEMINDEWFANQEHYQQKSDEFSITINRSAKYGNLSLCVEVFEDSTLIAENIGDEVKDFVNEKANGFIKLTYDYANEFEANYEIY